MVIVSCPECENRIHLDSKPVIGQRAACEDCQTVFEVTWLFPICLDYLDYEKPVSDVLNEGIE